MTPLPWRSYALAAALGFILGLLLTSGPTTRFEEHTQHITTRERVRHDTVLRIITVPTQAVHVTGRAAERPRPVRFAEAPAIVAPAVCLDTLLCDTLSATPDTLSVCYAPQRSLFMVAFRPSPRHYPMRIAYDAHDSVITQIDSFREATSSGHHWYDELMLILVSVAAGLILSRF